MDKDQWMYDNIMSKEVSMNEQNEDGAGVNEEHVDCSNVFNTSQVFTTRDDFSHWAQSITYEIEFVAVIMRSDTNTDIRERTSFVLIDCEKSGQYRSRKQDFVKRDIGSRKYRCPFKLRRKPVVGGQGWIVKLMCGSHNHEMPKSLVGHLYPGRLTKDEKTIIADMQRSAYCSSIRGSDTEMQQLMKLLERDQCIYWHRLKDEDVCHPNAVKLCNAYNLVFLIDSTCKTKRYRLLLLDFVGVTPTGMTFSTEWFRGLFLRRDALLGVIVTDRDLALMNAVKIVFPECTNLLCRFHINMNVKAKCKSLIGQKICGIMSLMPGGVWLIVLSSISLMISLRSLKLLVHHGQCLLTMSTKHGQFPTKKNLLKPGRIRVESAHWALKRLTK
ncbi:hypothetical protein GmHk_01G000948 [Glycine max]|nr:hypothetical protein GmHk_01G000948 [Glycine max]